MNSTDKRELRKFGLLVGSVLMAIGTVPLLKGRGLNLYLIAAGVTLILLAFLTPGLLSPVYRVWMRIGRVLGRVNSFILLSLIFFIIVTPIGLIYRMSKKTH